MPQDFKLSRNRIFKIALGLATVLFGLFAFQFGFRFAVHEEETRRPAALPSVFEESEIKNAQSLNALHHQLLKSAEAFSINGSAGVRLGHFEVRGTNGLPISACSLYSRVEITYSAGDMAVSGEAPLMVVEGPCTLSGDGLTLSPLTFQFERIFKAEVKNQTMQTFDDPEVSATFINVSDTWPRMWVLNRVRLYDPAEPVNKSIVIEQSEIRDRLGKSLTLNY